MRLRRLLRASIVLYCASLIGCATPAELLERECNVRHVNWEPIADSGEITLAWRVDALQVQRNCKPDSYGCTQVRGARADVWLRDGRSPECALETLAHEIRHGMGQPGRPLQHD